VADVILLIAFSLSTGALVIFAFTFVARFRWAGFRMTRRFSSPDCLGRIRERHCHYCSSVCPLASRCALIAMDDYLRRHPGLLAPRDFPEQA
jgi:hypothetical protein